MMFIYVLNAPKIYKITYNIIVKSVKYGMWNVNASKTAILNIVSGCHKIVFICFHFLKVFAVGSGIPQAADTFGL